MAGVENGLKRCPIHNGPGSNQWLTVGPDNGPGKVRGSGPGPERVSRAYFNGWLTILVVRLFTFAKQAEATHPSTGPSVGGIGG